MEDKKIIEQNKMDSNEEEIDEGFEEYRKMLERQRKWLEVHPGVKVAYYVPPKKEDSDD